MSFDPGELKARASEATGLSDFGAEPFEDGLEVLCASLDREAGLNEKGRASAQAAIVATLSERLRVEDWVRRAPEILDEVLVPQVFVVGLPRTGTTALSQFMSQDPNARSIRRWELNSLTPPPDAAVALDPRLTATRAAFAARNAALPALRTMLPVEAEDPSEHGQLLGLTFRSLHNPTLHNVPTYTDWLLKADLRPAYRYLAKVLKLLQWKTPGRWWNLKNPPDVFALDAIAEVFPYAAFVWTHRDPANSIPSVSSLAALLRGQGLDHVDKPALMQQMLRFQGEGVRRGLAARERLGGRVIADFHQAEMARDPIGTIRALYERLALPFTASFEAHIRDRLENRPRAQHGRHEYDPAEYGASPEEIRGHFAEYLTRYPVALG